MDWGTVNRLIYNLVADNWVFDYATRYAAANKEIGPAASFEITDTLYSDFKKSIDPARFKYDKVCEELVKQLRTTAKNEGYMSEETEKELDKIAALLTHDLERDLDTHRGEIEEYLGSEIVGRYYYDRGKAAYELKNDKAMKLAGQILSDPEQYKAMLEKPRNNRNNKK